MGHFEKMMSKDPAKDITGKIVNYEKKYRNCKKILSFSSKK